MNIIERVKNIIVNPKKEWEVIDGESASIPSLLTGYVLPLTIIGALAAFIGYAFVGIDIGLGLKMKGMDWGLYQGLSRLIVGIVSFVISAYVVDALAASFASEKNINKSAQLVAYGTTPAMVGAFLGFLPMLAIIGGLFGLYSIYLWYLGLGPIKKTPEDKKVVYIIVSIIVYIVVMIIVGFVINKILMSVLGLDALGGLRGLGL
ncbi:MAG: YIP1 family protein [Rhizobacter sp.]|nr:YIP1 family protein [Ferruginibacter sp.]